MRIKYVSKKWTANTFHTAEGDSVDDNKKLELLWGDRVHVLDDSTSFWKIKARGVECFVNPDDLNDESLLELYFIDVGQGDGVLIKTPENRHILIDGGWPRRKQPLGKNAADFVDWKFEKDYLSDEIVLDAMICSHNDQDHYGGLWDLLDKEQDGELNTEKVCVENFYHAGLSWWEDNGKRTLGPSEEINGQKVWTRLLDDRQSIIDGLEGAGTNPKLQGQWADFLEKVKDAKTKSGDPTPVIRLSSETEYLPGYEEDKEVAIKVLAPVELDFNSSPALPKFEPNVWWYTNSKNTNGNSILLRMDYKKSRILLTGDLNTLSQQFLLEHYIDDLDEFKCDVAKACHHGSGDVSIGFLEAIEPACTIISSGDSEGHDHPKPSIVAASGLTGHKFVVNDKLITPLVYSTEIARSVPIGKIYEMNRLNEDGDVIETIDEDELDKFGIKFKVVYAGESGGREKEGNLALNRVIAKPTYGLINVRTDGKHIMCAALNEKAFKWNVESFKARF